MIYLSCSQIKEDWLCENKTSLPLTFLPQTPQVLKLGLKPENEMYFNKNAKKIFIWLLLAFSKASKVFSTNLYTVSIWIWSSVLKSKSAIEDLYKIISKLLLDFE